MTIAYLCQSEPTRERWIVPDAALFAKEGWVDAFGNMDVRAISTTGETSISDIFYPPANATVHAFRIVPDANNPGGHYLYFLFAYHYASGNRFFLRQVKLDENDNILSHQQKEYTTFFLAGQPNNRMAFDGAKVKDFSISGNGRALHIVYAHSATVWYDIYEYASSDYAVSWIPENTNQIHAGVLNSAGNTFWKFSSSNMRVIAALYNATAKTLQVRLLALTPGDHTNLTAAPAQTLEHTLRNVAAQPDGVLVSDDLNQFVLLGNGEFTRCNLASVSGTAFTVSTHKTTDARFQHMHHAAWTEGLLFWMSKTPARALPYRVMMHDARVNLEGWMVGPGGDGSPARSGTAPDGQTIYIGGGGGDGGEVLKFSANNISPATPMTITVTDQITRLSIAGQTIEARKGANGTANEGNEISRALGGLGNRFGNPGNGCQGSISPIGTVGGLGQSLDLAPFDGTDDPVQYGRAGGGGGDGGGQSGSQGGQRGSNDNVRDGQDGQDGKGDGGGGGRFNAPIGRGGKGGKGGVYIQTSRYLAGQTPRPATSTDYQNQTMHAYTTSGIYTAAGSAGSSSPAQLNAIRPPTITTERLPPATYVAALLTRTTHTLAMPTSESNYSEFRGISIQNGGKLYVLSKSNASSTRQFVYEFNLTAGANLAGSFSRKSNGLWSRSVASNFMFGTASKVGQFDPSTDRLRSYNLTTAGDIATLSRTGTNRRTIDDPGTTPATGHDYVGMFIRDANTADPVGVSRREGYILSTSSTQTIARRFWISDISVSFASWRSYDGVFLTDFTLDATKGGAKYISIADDGKKALILFDDNVLRTYAMDTGWDFANIRQTGSASFPAGTSISSACFHPDGKSVLVTDTAALNIAQFTL